MNRDDFDYRIRRSSRASRIRVTVDREGVTVVLPDSASEKSAEMAVARLGPWIRSKLVEQHEALELVRQRGDQVPWLGQLLPLVREPGRRIARRDHGQVLVPEGDHLQALESLFRRSARQEYSNRLDAITDSCRTTWSTLRIGDMKTRWGSCAPGGRISLSWRLMLAPEEVMETVLWHEVCHLDEPNHSDRFWKLMDERRPGHRADREWLRLHGAQLVL
ncbi:MAG: SprT family zinc-dependent metalloprotease [Solirubrobacterales bacterium]|nr:SprT family zinc-dependent metalloprotease [Solirubrobacterales bacterium]